MRWSMGTSLPLGLGVFLLLVAEGAAPQGTEFNLSCHANEVLVGIGGRQGWWMGGIAARCRTMNENGELGETVRSTEYRGGTAGTLRTFDCNQTEVMVGYNGMHGSNGYVLHVHEVICATWQPDSRTAGTETRTLDAFAEKAGAGQRMGYACAEGRIGTRVRGRAGNYLDRLMDIGCSYAVGATEPTRPVAQRRQVPAAPGTTNLLEEKHHDV